MIGKISVASLLLDTHAWVWFLSGSTGLPAQLIEQVKVAPRAAVSAVSVYEIAQKIHRNSWPGMTNELLGQMIAHQGIEILSMEAQTFRAAALLDWEHRDPFDRMIAATALEHDLAIISKDLAFDAFAPVTRIWE